MFSKFPLITLGSPNGIGYEVFLLSRVKENPLKGRKLVCIGSNRVMQLFMKIIGVTFSYRVVKSVCGCPSDFSEDFLLIDVDTDSTTIDCLEKITPFVDGEIAFRTIRAGAIMVEKGYFSSLVTLPVSKENINLIEPSFKGHTEYLQELWKQERVYMTFISKRLNVLLLTTHVALAEVAELINEETVFTGLTYAVELVNRMKLKKNICLLGLNPHAGENGLLGQEEFFMKQIVKDFSTNREIKIIGPVPADTAFTPLQIEKYGLYVTHYHDQGLIPFKMLAFEDGVNLSFGMKYIRTSVDHGTARDLIGKKKVNINSFVEAYLLAEKLSFHSQ